MGVEWKNFYWGQLELSFIRSHPRKQICREISSEDSTTHITDVFLAYSSTSSGMSSLLLSKAPAGIEAKGLPFSFWAAKKKATVLENCYSDLSKAETESHSGNTSMKKLEFDRIQSLNFYFSSGKLIFSIWFSRLFFIFNKNLGYIGVVLVVFKLCFML